MAADQANSHLTGTPQENREERMWLVMVVNRFECDFETKDTCNAGKASRNQRNTASNFAHSIHLQSPDNRKWDTENDQIGDNRNNAIGNEEQVCVQTPSWESRLPELGDRIAHKDFDEGDDNVVDCQNGDEHMDRSNEYALDGEDPG